jgi:hypothetical protein
LGKVFAGTDIQYNQPWTTTLSHELLEMLLDPNINLVASDAQGTFWAYEACDAVESNYYTIGNTKVSDFLLPAYFDPNLKTGKFSYMGGSLTGPFTIAAGGYASKFDPQNGWTQIWGPQTIASYASRPKVGSRRALRNIAPQDRLLSI